MNEKKSPCMQANKLQATNINLENTLGRRNLSKKMGIKNGDERKLENEGDDALGWKKAS